MSDEMLGFWVTVLLLVGLAAWVPLLHAAERLTRQNVRLLDEVAVEDEEPVLKEERELA